MGAEKSYWIGPAPLPSSSLPPSTSSEKHEEERSEKSEDIEQKSDELRFIDGESEEETMEEEGKIEEMNPVS